MSVKLKTFLEENGIKLDVEDRTKISMGFCVGNALFGLGESSTAMRSSFDGYGPTLDDALSFMARVLNGEMKRKCIYRFESKEPIVIPVLHHDAGDFVFPDDFGRVAWRMSATGPVDWHDVQILKSLEESK